jgi:C4-dicarboxylate transporter
MVVGFGVVLAVGVGDAAGDGEVAGGGVCASGVTIGFAGAGFFCASSATANFIASETGMWATPFALSTQPYVVSAVIISACAACSFSARAFARFFS